MQAFSAVQDALCCDRESLKSVILRHCNNLSCISRFMLWLKLINRDPMDALIVLVAVGIFFILPVQAYPATFGFKIKRMRRN